MAKREKAVKAKSRAKAKAKAKRATKRGKATKPKKPAPKSKAKLSQTPSARRARARRASAREQKNKAAARRKRARLEAESIQLGEEAHREQELAAQLGRAAGDEYQLMVDVFAEMRNAGAGVVSLSLDITEPEVGASSPWLLVGRFDLNERVTYADLFDLFNLWRNDLTLEALIHPQRTAQIRICYDDPSAKRGEARSWLAHIGPWEKIVSEAAAEIDPKLEDSLANRYKETTVSSFYVYFSGRLASEVAFSL